MNQAHKVQPHHLERAAYLYVRQSSMRQVMENVESSKRQYALRGRAVALGWSEDKIVVIDSDQGESGASASWREGFQRLVSDVGLGRAGIVMGLEVSPAGEKQRRLASTAGDLRPCRHADPRRGRGLRSSKLQRQTSARPQGHDERGGAACYQGPTSRRDPEQGPARRVSLHSAYGTYI